MTGDWKRTDEREETRLFLRLLVIMQPVRNQFELLKVPSLVLGSQKEAEVEGSRNGSR